MLQSQPIILRMWWRNPTFWKTFVAVILVNDTLHILPARYYFSGWCFDKIVINQQNQWTLVRHFRHPIQTYCQRFLSFSQCFLVQMAPVGAQFRRIPERTRLVISRQDRHIRDIGVVAPGGPGGFLLLLIVAWGPNLVRKLKLILLKKRWIHSKLYLQWLEFLIFSCTQQRDELVIDHILSQALD